MRHHHPKNAVDARRIASAVLLKPFEYVGIQTHGYQFLWGLPKLGELVVGERRDLGIVDLRNIRAFLAVGSLVQRFLLPLSEGLVPYRFCAHADLLPAPR